MLRRLLVLLALCVCAAGAAPAADSARAWLDRDAMQLGETVTLNVESSQSGGEPDFSALQADFELLGRSSSSSVSIVNGATTRSMLWAVGLKPRREGKLAIPPLRVGTATTAAIALDVAAAPVVASARPGDDLYVELSADPLDAYVQQQVRVSVKFYYAVNLTDGALEELEVGGAVVQKLGQDRNYDAEVSGRRYRVLERRYAVKAEKSGTLRLPSIGFRGRALNGNDPNALFFGRGRTVTTRSEELAVTVKPRPAGSAAGAWLPAQSLELQVDGLDASRPARVGEPLTLTVTTTAQGLGFEQLPEIELPAIEGAEVYPDKSTTRTRESSGWLVGERSRKFAIVPQRAGKLQIPALQLDWWDTGKDAAAQARTPAFTVEVEAGTASTAPSPAAADAADSAATPAAANAAGSAPGYWRTIALTSFGLWLLSAGLLFWRWRRSVRQPPAATALTYNPGRRSFEQAAATGDAAATAQRLLAWARSEGLRTRHLGELAAALTAPAQRAAIAQLQAALYASDPPPLPRDVAQAFAQGLALVSTPRSAADPAGSLLPPLWRSEQR